MGRMLSVWYTKIAMTYARNFVRSTSKPSCELSRYVVRKFRLERYSAGRFGLYSIESPLFDLVNMTNSAAHCFRK